MTPLLLLSVAIAGGLGAVARFFVDGAITARLGNRYPIGTTLINLSGSFLLGLVVGLAGGALVGVGHFGVVPVGTALLPSDVRSVVGTGLLGGYTTFSTASFDTVTMLRNRRYGAALLNGIVQLLASVGAATLGLLLAAALV